MAPADFLTYGYGSCTVGLVVLWLELLGGLGQVPGQRLTLGAARLKVEASVTQVGVPAREVGSSGGRGISKPWALHRSQFWT